MVWLEVLGLVLVGVGALIAVLGPALAHAEAVLDGGPGESSAEMPPEPPLELEWRFNGDGTMPTPPGGLTFPL